MEGYCLIQGLRPRSVGCQAETGLIPNGDPGRSSRPTAPCWAGGPHGPDGGVRGPKPPVGGDGEGARNPCWCCRGLTKPLLVLFFHPWPCSNLGLLPDRVNDQDGGGDPFSGIHWCIAPLRQPPPRAPLFLARRCRQDEENCSAACAEYDNEPPLLPAGAGFCGSASARDRGRQSSVGMDRAITFSGCSSRVIVISSSGGSTSSAPASSPIASVRFEELPRVETAKFSSNSSP